MSSENTTKKASIFDVDNVLSRGFYIVKFPYALHEENLFPEDEFKIIIEIFEEYKKGCYPYEKFAWDLVNAFGRGMKGKKKEDIEKTGENYILFYPEEKFQFTDGLIRMVKGKGYETVVISGSPYEIVLPFSNSLEIDKTFATTYEVDGKGKFTGEVLQNCAVIETKREVTKKYLQDNNINKKASAGFGDSHHDLAFLEMVGYPVAINPNRELENVAMSETGRRWLICKEEGKVLNSVGLYLP
jgi:HAD superfamily phosphoserine phosphatase-like hydrolase